MNQSNSLAQFMDEISRLAGEPDRSLLPAVIKLGISSAKSDYHFYSAFSNWLSENIEEYGGVIPNKFKLTDNCWATLMTCLTYKDVLEKSVQMSRTRAVDHKDKLLSQTPRFDFDKLFESWEKNNI